MKKNIDQRIFIVGCPRSGTTLLQTLLLQHSDILSFPESHFFTKSQLYDFSRKLNIKKYISNIYAYFSLKRWFNILQTKGFITPSFHYHLFTSGYVNQFIDSLDQNTLYNNKTIWIEKTPSHLYTIKTIQQYIPDAKFIHLIRRGEDVVASLYEATNNYPEIWGKAYTIQDCINRYNKDISISKKFKKNKNHFFIDYDMLIESLDNIRELYDFLNLKAPNEIKIIPNKSIIMEDEKWKNNNLKKKLVNTKNEKFKKIFSEDEQEYITRSIYSFYDNNCKQGKS